jgi:hypothetical protein
MQLPCSWGELFTKAQWENFSAWFEEHKDVNYTDQLPSYIADLWTAGSWKKHFADYMINTGKYFIYPRVALSTNFSEQGSTASYRGGFQVPLLTAERKFILKKASEAKIKYDVNFEINPAYLKSKNPHVAGYDFEVDLFGTKKLTEIKTEYLLSAKKSTHPVYSFGNDLVGCVQNILMGSEGTFYTLGKTAEFTEELPDRLEYYTSLNPVKKIIFSSTIYSEANAIAVKVYEEWRATTEKEFDREFEKWKEMFKIQFAAEYDENFQLHQQFPLLQVAILDKGIPGLLSKTLTSIFNQNYPASQLSVKIFSSAASDPGAASTSGQIEYVAFSSEKDMAEKFLNAAIISSAQHYCITNAGDIFHPLAFDTVNRIFKRYADIVWINGQETKPNPAENLAGKRWNEHIFEQSLLQPTKGHIVAANTFWRKYAWEIAKDDIRPGGFEDLCNNIWRGFFKHHKLYTCAVQLAELREGQAAGNREILIEPTLPDRIAEFMFLKNWPYARAYYRARNELPPLVRLDKTTNLFYLSEY